MTPHRIGGKHNHVSPANRYINNCRFVCEFSTARKHTADEQILFIGNKAEDNTWPRLRWNKEWTLALLSSDLIRVRTIGWVNWTRLWHRLNYVGIVDAASSGSTSWAPDSPRSTLSTATTTTKTASSATSNLKQRRLAKVDRKTSIVAISDWAFAICEGRVVDRTTSLEFVGLLNRDAISNAVVDGYLGNAANSNKQTALFNKLLEVCHSRDRHAAAHVIGLIRGITTAWSYRGRLPWNWIATSGHAIDDRLR